MLRRLIASRPRALAIAGIATLLALVGLLLLNSALVPASYDRTFAFGFNSQLPTNPPVAIVYLDLESYLSEKQNPDAPWSRALHAQFLRRLTRAGAKAVVFDIIFDAPGADAAVDADFAAAIRENGRVILGAELDFSSRASMQELGMRDSKVILPTEKFLNAAAGWGIAKVAIDDDFVVRQIFAGRLSQNQPSLVWATAKLLDLPVVRAAAANPARRWLRYYGGALTIPHVGYHAALDAAEVSDDFFRDKIVFVGARPIAGSFRERKDEFRSPFSSWGQAEVFMPAVEVHATQMMNLALGDWLQRLPARAEAAVLVLAAVIFSVLLFRFRPLPATGVALASGVASLVLVAWAFGARQIWFPWLIVVGVQLPGALGGSILYHSLEWYRTRRRLEVAKREAEVKIREQAALIDKAQDAILVADLAGRVIYANASAEKLYGWTNAELQAEGAVEQLFAPSAAKATEARKLILEKSEWLGELEQATRSGQKLTVESRWTLIRDDAGKPKSVLLINTDITEKKKLEAQFLRAQRMDSIGSIAGGMAHDLNNALSPILIGIQLIGRKVTDEDTQRLLAMMEASTHRGADMVRQVLTFSRGRDGERELLKVGQIVREMEHIVRQTLPKTIKITAMLPGDLWQIHGNSTQLHQVLLNLCVNARDAMPAGGELTLAADNVELDAAEAKTNPDAKPGNYVMLLVSDTGTGIPPEVLARMFEPFFTTKDPGKGTGLGLSTIVRIVRNHGGFVSVKSEVGLGTTFEIYFPKAEIAAAKTGAVAGTELPRGRGELILLIEDDQVVREIIESSLNEYGYRVVSAVNGVEAMALLAQHEREVRLVVSDLTIPGASGATILESIRAKCPGLPTILMSGELDSVKNNPAVKVTAFLAKPFRLEQLFKVITEALAVARL